MLYETPPVCTNVTDATSNASNAHHAWLPTVPIVPTLSTLSTKVENLPVTFETKPTFLESTDSMWHAAEDHFLTSLS